MSIFWQLVGEKPDLITVGIPGFFHEHSGSRSEAIFDLKLEFSGAAANHHHVRFQPQTRQTRCASPKPLTLAARSLAPRASPSPTVPLPVPADTTINIFFLIKEELEVPYEIKFYKREPNQLAPKELLKVNPLGKAPVITDGDVTLAESGAIIRA